MSGRFLLDTSIIIGIFAGEAPIIGSLARADEIFVPVIALGELFYGAYHSSRPRANISRISEFSTANVILGCDMSTSEMYGRIKNSLRRRGTPIPENDIWIAAIAKQHGLVLVTRDSHFQQIEDLTLVQW